MEKKQSFLEFLSDQLWIAWLVLGFVGAVISAPHTLNTVLPTVDLPTALQWAYSLAVFLGVEGALILLAIASQLRKRDIVQRQFSLAGVVNRVLSFIGTSYRIDTTHIEERSGGGLLIFLFVAAVSFNLLDVWKVTAFGQLNSDVIELTVKTVIGFLGPVITLMAGERFAYEVVRRYRENRHSLAKPNEESVSTLERANEARTLSKQEAVTETLRLIREGVTDTSQIANQTGKSRSSIYDYLSELESSGMVRKDAVTGEFKAVTEKVSPNGKL